MATLSRYLISSVTIQPCVTLLSKLKKTMNKIKIREARVKVPNKTRRSSNSKKRTKKLKPMMKMMMRRRMRPRMMDERSFHERPDNKHTLCLLAVLSILY